MTSKLIRRTALVLGVAALTAVGVWSLTSGPDDPPSESAATVVPVAAVKPAPAGTPEAAEPAPAQAKRATATGEFPKSWFYPNRRTGGRYDHHVEMEGKPAPEYSVHNWIGSPVEFKDTKGKIVVIDFWATWCRPCMRAVPKNVKMVDKYKDKGLVFLGIHDNRRGTERMAQAVEANRMNYPVAIDKDGLSQRAYRVSFWPTYTVIDHKGVVRAAGIIPDYVEHVVSKLVKERDEELRKKS